MIRDGVAGHDADVSGLAKESRSGDYASPLGQLVDLMNRYEQSLWNYLIVMLRDSEAAHDCAQDTFLRAFENLSRGRPVNATWLYTVARHRAIDYLREARRAGSDLGILEDIEAPEDRVSSEVESVRRALIQLSDSDREILYLSIVDKFTTAEIAALLGIRPTALRVRLFRARDRFRSLYRSTS